MYFLLAPRTTVTRSPDYNERVRADFGPNIALACLKLNARASRNSQHADTEGQEQLWMLPFRSLFRVRISQIDFYYNERKTQPKPDPNGEKSKDRALRCATAIWTTSAKWSRKRTMQQQFTPVKTPLAGSQHYLCVRLRATAKWFARTERWVSATDSQHQQQYTRSFPLLRYCYQFYAMF